MSATLKRFAGGRQPRRVPSLAAGPRSGTPVAEIGGYLDQSAAADALRQILERAEHDCTLTDEGQSSWVSNRGLLVVAGHTDTRFGFGVRSALRVTASLVAAIAEVNRSDPFGHLWLTEDGLGGTWALLWGATMPHRWTHRMDLQRAVFACLTDHRGYLADLVIHFAAFGGVPYWTDPTSRRGLISAGRGLLEDLS